MKIKYGLLIRNLINKMEDYSHIKTILQPTEIRVDLFQHQLASIYSMENLEREQKIINCDDYMIETKVGINADHTGYGKTISMIGLVARDKMEWDLTTPHVIETITSEAGGKMIRRRLKRFERLPATLVLASQSIIGQWEQEFLNTDLTVGKVTTKKSIDEIDPEEYDVILVSPSMYNKLISSHAKYSWKRFIFDEPGHMRVVGMKSVNAGFYWFVTATPNSIMNQHRNCKGFLKEIIGNGWWDFESQFSDVILRNNIDFVKSSFEMPSTHHHYHDCFNPISNAINEFVTPNISMMISAGNIEDAITALGGDKTSNLMELVKRKKLEELEEIESKIRIYTIRIDEARIKTWTDKRDRVNNQINEIESRFELMLKGNCNICLDKIRSPVLEPNCQNIFCGECLLTWMINKLSCPVCRAVVTPQELICVSSIKETVHQPLQERTLSKLEKTIEIISSDPGNKVLIFSAYDNTFSPIIATLKENNIKYAVIQGTLSTREKRLKSFRERDTSVIFLNSTFNGAGINLQEATDIILYHEMSTDTQNQILGRANRIGRQKPLQVHHLQVRI
jgi:SNF2 family DNA or RNA helicase